MRRHFPQTIFVPNFRNVYTYNLKFEELFYEKDVHAY